jgi:hypothetical protein
MKLEEILGAYGVPDPKIVGKLPKGGQSLSFVGHADITKMLIEVDSEWTWEPVAFDVNGLPAYRVENGMAHMAGWLTVQGVRRLGIGSVMHNKPDLLKELVSDFIRNSAMRFGICLSLWTKQEWDDHAPVVVTPAPKVAKAEPVGDAPLSQEQIEQFIAACEKAGFTPEVVADNAKVNWGKGAIVLSSHLPLLRSAFNDLKSFKEGA